MSMSNLQKTNTIVFAMLVVTLAGFALFKLSKHYSEQLVTISETQKETLRNLESRYTYGEERLRKVLFIKQYVLDYQSGWDAKSDNRKKLTSDEAYLLASAVMKATEIYRGPDFKLDPFFLVALMEAESSFNPLAISPVGARGLTQIMPVNGYWIQASINPLLVFDPDNLFDIETSIRFSARYLYGQYVVYKTWDRVLADYNGGPRHVHSIGEEPNTVVGPYIKKILKKQENLASLYKNFHRGVL